MLPKPIQKVAPMRRAPRSPQSTDDVIVIPANDDVIVVPDSDDVIVIPAADDGDP